MTFKEQVRIRDLNTCVYCGEMGSEPDHIYPQSLGGKTTLNNLVWSCHRCNMKKRKDGQYLPEMMVKAFRYLRSIGVEIV